MIQIGIICDQNFILTHYEGIIAGSLRMPNPRYADILMPTPGGEDPVIFTMWLTPTEPAALIGMLIYATVFLVLAYFIYQRRQSKSE